MKSSYLVKLPPKTNPCGFASLSYGELQFASFLRGYIRNLPVGRGKNMRELMIDNLRIIRDFFKQERKFN